jgi:NADH:ubiquinone oxidoreductase subunit 3 (subunit A)
MNISSKVVLPVKVFALLFSPCGCAFELYLFMVVFLLLVRVVLLMSSVLGTSHQNRIKSHQNRITSLNFTGNNFSFLFFFSFLLKGILVHTVVNNSNNNNSSSKNSNSNNINNSNITCTTPALLVQHLITILLFLVIGTAIWRDIVQP